VACKLSKLTAFIEYLTPILTKCLFGDWTNKAGINKNPLTLAARGF